MTRRRRVRRWQRRLMRRRTTRRIVGGAIAAVAAVAGLGLILPATLGLAELSGALAAADPTAAGGSHDGVPTMSSPPQRIGCGPLDVRYAPQGAPLNIDADVRAVFTTVAEAAGRPVTFDGPVTGVRIDVRWSREISPAAGETRLPLNRPIRSATIRLNADLRLRAGDVAGGWRVVGLHEAGHAMGLDHDPAPRGGVMVPAFDDTTAPQFTQAQAAAIRWAASSPSCS